jgi:hypothetical protein
MVGLSAEKKEANIALVKFNYYIYLVWDFILFMETHHTANFVPELYHHHALFEELYQLLEVTYTSARENFDPFPTP